MSSGSEDVLWSAAPNVVRASNIARFAQKAGIADASYAALHAWSVNDPIGFHTLLWDELGIIGERGETVVVHGKSLRDTRFFPEARLNYAENLLTEADERVAIIAHRDDGLRRELSRKALYDLVSRIAQALTAEGVGPGDRVAAIVTNDIESVAFYLATSAVGAIWASCSPDFGPASAADRLGQIAPALLVATPAYAYGGKQFHTGETIAAVAEAPSVRRAVLLGQADGIQGARSFDEWLAPFAPGPIPFERLGFDAPLAILFSSGTTGKPKCIVHSAGGLLLQHKKEHVLHCDLRAGEVMFYYSTCGWMMWNWLVSGLASGATIVTYDGNPSFPQLSRMPDLIDAEGIAVFGTSARYIDACQKAGSVPAQTHSLASLRLVLSTGSPLLPENFDYIYGNWKQDVHLASISGGTDICGCFLGGNLLSPVRRGELQGAMLGLDVAVLDSLGRPVVGEAGELVCRNAHVSMPVSFWGDATGERYQAAYFDTYPGIWAQGDFAAERASGGFVIYGRSDATLNPGGVRIGTAEIYRQLESIADVLEAAAIAQEWQGDQRVVLFVRLRDTAVLDETLETTIRSRIRKGATPRHVPARIVEVPDFPRTRSGKLSEIAIRQVIHGREVANLDALANPDSLRHFREIARLRN